MGGLLGVVVDRMSDTFDAVITNSRRKLVALGLVAAIEHAGSVGSAAGLGPLLRNRLSGVLSCCSEIIFDDAEAAAKATAAAADGPPRTISGSAGDTKWKQFCAQDGATLRLVDMRAALGAALQRAMATNGEAFQAAMAEVDPVLIGQLRGLGLC